MLGAFAMGETTAERGPVEILRDLAHDLRGPLGAIESIVFYLEMVADANDPRLQGQFSQLRRHVQQADWLLDDATRFLDAATLPRNMVCVNEVLTEVASHSGDDLASALELNLSPSLPAVLLPRSRAELAFSHLISFIRNVACCEALPAARTSVRDGQLAVDWSVLSPGWKQGELVRWLDPREGGGGLRRFAEGVGGIFRADDSDEQLRVSFVFPAFG